MGCIVHFLKARLSDCELMTMMMMIIIIIVVVVIIIIIIITIIRCTIWVSTQIIAFWKAAQILWRYETSEKMVKVWFWLLMKEEILTNVPLFVASGGGGGAEIPSQLLTTAHHDHSTRTTTNLKNLYVLCRVGSSENGKLSTSNMMGEGGSPCKCCDNKWTNKSIIFVS